MRPSLSTLTLSSALVKRRFDMEGGEGRSRRALARGTRPRVSHGRSKSDETGFETGLGNMQNAARKCVVP